MFVVAMVLLLMASGALCTLGWVSFELNKYGKCEKLQERCSNLLTVCFVSMFICMVIVCRC